MFRIFSFLLFVISKSSIKTEDLLLVQPYVNAKGDSKVANFYGDFSIVSYGGDQHIKLGYLSPGTRGHLIYKNQIGNDQFQVEFKIYMEDLKVGEKGSGMLIFFSDTENIETSSFYGIKPGFEGFCVAFDIFEGYDVSVNVETGKIDGFFKKSKDQKTYRFYEKEAVSVKIIQDHEGLRVVLYDEYEELVAYKSKESLINKKSFIGVSASNGNQSSGSFAILSIETSDIVHVPVYFEKGERESSSKMIWFVFILGAAGLLFYLYDKQIKKRL